MLYISESNQSIRKYYYAKAVYSCFENKSTISKLDEFYLFHTYRLLFWAMWNFPLEVTNFLQLGIIEVFGKDLVTSLNVKLSLQL